MNLVNLNLDWFRVSDGLALYRVSNRCGKVCGYEMFTHQCLQRKKKSAHPMMGTTDKVIFGFCGSVEEE